VVQKSIKYIFHYVHVLLYQLISIYHIISNWCLFVSEKRSLYIHLVLHVIVSLGKESIKQENLITSSMESRKKEMMPFC